jgi:hypothetical protein
MSVMSMYVCRRGERDPPYYGVEDDIIDVEEISKKARKEQE